MILLVIGIALFLGVHLCRVFAPGFRTGFIAKYGLNAWKGAYSAASLITFVILIYGFGQARLETPMLWHPPVWTAHLNMTLMLIAIILLVSSLLPAGHIAVAVKHPMVLSVKIWALAHLIANGSLADVLLFGSFLAWGVILRIYYARAQRAGTIMPRPFVSVRYDGMSVLLGLVLYGAILMFLHEWLIGVSPLDMIRL